VLVPSPAAAQRQRAAARGPTPRALPARRTGLDALALAPRSSSSSKTSRHARPGRPGMLGDSAQQEFARSWGVSYGMNAVTEWKARIAAGGQLHCAMRSRASPPPVRNLAGHCDGGAEGRNHPGHPGAPVPDAQQRLAGGGVRCFVKLCPPLELTCRLPAFSTSTTCPSTRRWRPSTTRTWASLDTSASSSATRAAWTLDRRGA
jgi:hypothetical protein